jgi:eukaryotic-like serine/threonine-protein kinase
MIGKTVSHYRIVEKLGGGGMGVVYKATDTVLDRPVALKVLSAQMLADPAAVRAFLREAKSASSLNHPNILTVHDLIEGDGVHFLVMEFVQGRTLRELISGKGMEVKSLLNISVQVAEALAAAHKAGIIHRDLKPENIMVRSDGHSKVVDFGLAKLVVPQERIVTGPSLTQSTVPFGSAPAAPSELSAQQSRIAGTLPYMSPEQLTGKPLDARTDIFSFGVVLYEMTTAQRPFQGATTGELVQSILEKEPRPVTDSPRVAPEKLPEIIAKCLEKDPDDRYQHIEDAAVDLRRLKRITESAGKAVMAAVEAPSKRVRWERWRKPAFALMAGIAVLALVLTLALGLNVGRWRDRLLGRGTVPHIESLAVLPLENLSGDPGQEYFADGMTDELITNLGRISSLRVISRTSIMQYKKASKTLPAIARELNVDAVVEGSVLRSGNRVRITAQLIQAQPERQLWTNSYERDLKDALVLQDDVARAITDGIQIKVEPEEKGRLTSARAVDPRAHDAYLQGLFFLYKETREDLAEATKYAERAIQLNPNYADALALLAACYYDSSESRLGEVPNALAAQKATETALKATQLDGSLAEPHVVLGAVHDGYDWNWTGAEREFRRAVELDPNLPQAHVGLAWHLMFVGRRQEAISAASRAVELDPVSSYALSNQFKILYFTREFDQAIALERRQLEINPNDLGAYFLIGNCYEAEGKYAEAVAAWQRAMTPPGAKQGVTPMESAYQAEGIKGVWRWQLTMLQKAPSAYQSPYEIAILYSRLGDKDKALAVLEKLYSKHGQEMAHVNQEPGFDSIRSDPRFQALVRRMNFPA